MTAETVINVNELVRKFGAFTAVDRLSFSVRRGEIFGLLGPNGAGKTTTFRMLCGLLPATSGTLRVAGFDLRTARASARQRIGYVAQKFSLYGQLSVAENLDFFASAYGLRGSRKRERIALGAGAVRARTIDAPRQRRNCRAATSSGWRWRRRCCTSRRSCSSTSRPAAPIRWRGASSGGGSPPLREQGVTVIVTTHFMEEAEYCDRIAILDAGRMLAQGTPASVRSRAALARPAPTPTMEDAFIAIVEAAREHKPRCRQITAVRRDCDRQSSAAGARGVRCGEAAPRRRSGAQGGLSARSAIPAASPSAWSCRSC